MPENEPLFSFTWEGKAVGANHQFADKRSKRLNPAYAAFKHEIRTACSVRHESMGGLLPIIYPVPLFLRINMYIDRMRDSDSLLKPLFDGLQFDPFSKLGVIKNDRQIRGYTVITFPHKRGAADRIELKAYKWESAE